MKTRKIGDYTYNTKKRIVNENDYVYDKATNSVNLATYENIHFRCHVVMSSDDPAISNESGEGVDPNSVTNHELEPLPSVVSKDVDTQLGIVTKLADPNDQLFLKCPTCGSIHFRHAGYVLPLSQLSYRSASLKHTDEITAHNVPVNLCLKCKTCIVSSEGKVVDVTEYIDIEAWSKSEEEIHKATGPGGQC